MNKKKVDRFFDNPQFIHSSDARSLRILSEYLGPKQRFNEYNVEDTIVFFGSARIQSQSKAEKAIAMAGKDITEQEKLRLKKNLKWSRYYRDAKNLAYQITEWSKKLKNHKHRYIVTSGGGPGIMEATNKGASKAKGLTIGLNITLPFEQSGNKWITPNLNMQFHYFFIRKFWMAYLAKGLVAFPGGFGTLDELFEILTLIQTKKIKKHIPIVLFGKEFWESVINWDYLVEAGTIQAEDLQLFKIMDNVEEAFSYITTQLTTSTFTGPNF